MIEQTYVMLKPDALQRGLVGEILCRIERRGYRPVKMKTICLTEQVLREHYAHIVNEPYFPPTLTYMTSGPVLAMVVEGEGAIAGMRQLMGATRIENAAPGTIRGDFANSTTHNLIHGADSPENAKIEIARFFGASSESTNYDDAILIKTAVK